MFTRYLRILQDPTYMLLSLLLSQSLAILLTCKDVPHMLHLPVSFSELSSSFRFPWRLCGCPWSNSIGVVLRSLWKWTFYHLFESSFPLSVSECLLSAFIKSYFIYLPFLFTAGMLPTLRAHADWSACRPCHRGPVNFCKSRASQSRAFLETLSLTRCFGWVCFGLCLWSLYWWPVADSQLPGDYTLWFPA